MPHPTIHAVCLASSGRALSGTCSGPAAFVNNRKKTSLHESILSGIKARFGALARYAAALDEKAAARLSAADHPQQAAKQLETLLRLPETGTLLHFEAVRAAHGAGLDPLLGFYHRPSFGRESLACDLIEPLRPVIDEWLWNQFASGPLRPEHFSSDKGACLLGKAGRGHFYAQWEAFAPPLRRWLRQTCRQLTRNLRSEGLPWLGDDHEDEEF